MQVLSEPSAVRAAVAEARRAAGGAAEGGAGGTVGLVPTMGALHAGHLSLVERARRECAVTVASVFVNPLQFGPGEDFAAYPRNREGDLAQLERRGVAIVFAPETSAFTPPTARTTVHVRALTDTLEGASRPGHFDGVATVVCKLLNVVRPERAYFGEKDYQQLVVLRRMAADLDTGVEIVGCPIVRDADGLALSSRNAYLSSEEREQALALSQALQLVRGDWDGDADSARALLRRTLQEAPGVDLDYAEVCDPETLVALEGVVDGPARALVAARVGGTRLIDNIRLDPRRSGPVAEGHPPSRQD